MPTPICLRCRLPLPIAAGPDERRVCAGCGAPFRVDGVAIDVVPDHAPPATLGARAMQSTWLARIYRSWWRPIAFGLSTAFGAPRSRDEARLVLALAGEAPGPWLDLSCGPGHLTRELVARAGGRDVVAVDLSRAMLAAARTMAPTALLVRADAAALPFEDGTFGAVINLAALDLYADMEAVLAECARVLAPGGRWIGSTFVAGRGRTERRRRAARMPAGGSRKPTEGQLASALQKAGLRAFGIERFRGYIVAWADKR
ncbi:MAG TPA: class I SAM-dependent methyltransferase [Polyangiaceae bacterium]|nr:class I SAM-dependent methyltransferase [Polyangiaceae bacterium]